MDDEFLEGDYDSRIQNDVLLYIFKDDLFVYSRQIPYDSIARGVEYPIDKMREVTGDLKFVAWAVKRDVSDRFNGGETLTIHDERHPRYDFGSRFQDHLISMSPIDPDYENGHYLPINNERYIGVLDPTEEEDWDHNSYHKIKMRSAPGRIIVNITDKIDALGEGQEEAYALVSGVMSQMSLDKEGLGTPVSVRAELEAAPASTRAETGTTHTTGIFGVLPSSQGQRLSVDIMRGTEKLETMTVYTNDHLHEKIESGELLEFDYVLDTDEFTITVGSWTQKISIVDL